MRKIKIYLDSSVISHLDAPDKPDWMADTLMLWEQIKAGMYEVYISDVVIGGVSDNTEPKRSMLFQYLSQIQYTIVPIDDEVKSYATKLHNEGILSDKHYNDCLHIGCAAVSDCSILLSWNLKHNVKAKTINGVRSINAILGYRNIDIYTPTIFI